ncbi:MAG: LicD family protein [Candidatus Saccharibacteria bacterium]|nr:LicD family protein [Candidatus Saccharibacteria bacterium]
MNDTQKVILDIFKEYKKICDKHGLKYFGLSGTTIGAVRHGGFIPWDDDLDVAMPIDDYLKFREIALKELGRGYELLDSRSRKTNPQMYMKVRDSRTTYIEGQYADKPRYFGGVWMDVFPIAMCPSNKLKISILKIRLRFYRKMDMLRNQYTFRESELKNKLMKILFLPVVYICKSDHYLNRWERTLVIYNRKANNKKIILPWRLPPRRTYHNIFPCEFFESTEERKFEDTTMMIPTMYDEYLRMDFGDYMKLPPKSARVTHFEEGATLDLNKPYIEYVKTYHES